MVQPIDLFNRPLRALRISVTDRCNLRCAYCMPEQDYAWIPHEQILTFEEVSRVADAFASLGVARLRLTGGEPLLRRDLPTLVGMLAQKPALRDLALTTNGVLLPGQAAALAAAGLRRVTISLDTLRPARFASLCRSEGLNAVLAGIDAAAAAGLSLKLNTVVIRGTNDDELPDLVEFARRRGAEIRFIEYMDVPGATQWSREDVVSRAEILGILERRFGRIEPAIPRTALRGPGPSEGASPAERFLLPDGTIFGIIASTTAPFCGSCDRSRLTADGMWYMCLYAKDGIDLKAPLRARATTETIAALVESTWRRRTDRGAEQRLAEADRGAFVPVNELRRDYHLEMHKRGG